MSGKTVPELPLMLIPDSIVKTSVTSGRAADGWAVCSSTPMETEIMIAHR